MSSETTDSVSSVKEMPLEAIRELKRKACEKLSSLIKSVSSTSSEKRSKSNNELFSTYKALIRSYKFEFWAGNEVSPRELAVYGWECKGRDQVQCLSCKQYLCTSVPKITDVDIAVYNKCMKRVRSQIISAHVLTCIYRSKPLEFKHDVDENFLRDIVRPRASTYNNGNLKLDTIIPDDIVWSAGGDESSLSKEAELCSSLGWSIEVEKLAGKEHYVAVCDYCARSFMTGRAAFNPLKWHQKWCPVLDVNADDGIPLWKLIYRQMTAVKQQQRTSTSTIKEVESAKRVLDRSLSIISREMVAEASIPISS
ncbi:hypothetical protein Q1695_005842 [Nippostrongylus brasiliensis]|nr:hypothetical protein Q1695_005842 [Nippostrongylus brasiliensis]